ncbi:MAG TPA: hypothetical protein VMU59_02505 [Caulobacteraceae bacterium]|nr:hypothetical protein [Caulobacteraceae bacterium]
MTVERQRTGFAPALIGALTLHVAVLLAGILAWPFMGKPISPANVTAVTIVAAAPSIPPPAEKAPRPAPPTSPEPAPTPTAPPPPAPAPPVPPRPKPLPPKPAPPQPTPTPAPAPKPLPPKPTPPKPTAQAQPAKPTKPSQDLDLGALSASLDKSTSRKGPGAKGPPKLELSQIERLDQGASSAADKTATVDAAAAVGARLNHLWNKRCEVEGFRQLDDIRVQFQLTPEGGLQGAPQVVSAHKSDPVWQAAAEAAVRAVYQAQPFTELPRQTYSQWRTFTANYQAKEACK